MNDDFLYFNNWWLYSWYVHKTSIDVFQNTAGRCVADTSFSLVILYYLLQSIQYPVSCCQWLQPFYSFAEYLEYFKFSEFRFNLPTEESARDRSRYFAWNITPERICEFEFCLCIKSSFYTFLIILSYLIINKISQNPRIKQLAVINFMHCQTQLMKHLKVRSN